MPEEKNKKREVVLEGVPASPGISIGPCFVFAELTWDPVPTIISAEQVGEQIQTFRNSVNSVLEELKQTYRKTQHQYGDELAEIMEVQIAFLEDDIFLREVEELIESKLYDAAYATFLIFREKKEHFLQMSDEYFRERALDIHALKERIIQHILGREMPTSISIDHPAIVIADNLTPSETVNLHKQNVLGFATNAGGRTSHTAIVAKALSVPAVVGLKKVTEMAETGSIVILDGTHGKIILNPSPPTINRYKKEQKHFLSLEKKLLKESARESVTRDGKKVCLHANIEFEEELAQVKQVNADGIGLYRTEGLFINRPDLPGEDEQAEMYTRVAKKIYPQKVVIRTADIGGDKVLPGILTTQEENPFLGWRAIRFWLDHKIGFVAQLKAILRANRQHNVQLLLPMISGLDEVYQVKELLKEAKAQLRKEGKPFGEPIELGVMIEIPSMVILADVLAKEVDFVSIGTNDLVQYTLAVDRGNEKVAKLYSHFHPAILRMIKMIIDAGQKENITVGMCGEMAGDPLAIPLLLAIGIHCFSASPTVIPEIKRIIRELSITECEQLYRKVQSLTTTGEVVAVVKDFFHQKFPDIYVDN